MYWAICHIYLGRRKSHEHINGQYRLCSEKETNHERYWHDILNFQVYFFSFLVSTKYYPPLNLGNNKIKQDLL